MNRTETFNLVKGRQTGMALIFALLALVALTMGAVALIRSVDSGVMALGNLAFKQSGVTSGAKATEQAIGWVRDRLAGNTLNTDSVANGYYATDIATLDITGRTVGTNNVLAMVDWNLDDCKVNGHASGTISCATKPSAAVTIGGDQVQYVVTRLCREQLPPSQTDCSTPVTQNSTQALGRGSLDYGSPEQLGVSSYSPYYRIITRTVGPKGTVSFTETMIHF
ncbi:hypothetical protein LNV09_18810 [Paucibacter sp. B2R-40]|uniref:pilus assembly PilX family protein n=1 Tax=Paucibacter sp. B2R-40 TaxID=2893554 RepID=UPI0021E454C7|nr:hypothetical protein [Paucibacter sp. B2R-40]MCV2356199.1 hypothetical protein [Paucibacter sp. B2R-40]